MAANLICPNCYVPIADHTEKGCVLAALIGVLRERGTYSEEELRYLHEKCNVDVLWDNLVGRIVDKLGDGDFNIDADEG